MKTMCPPRLSPQWLCSNSCTWHMMYGSSFAQVFIMFPTVHHVPKCMSCHKAIVVITGRAHCFHDFIYITLVFLP